MNCIIKEKYIKGPNVTESQRRVAFITRTQAPKVTRSVRYENLETGEEYLCLFGGFAWPGLKPGFAVVLAAQESEEDKVIFKVLEEVEEKNVRALIQRSHKLFEKYGKNCGEIAWIWYGDYESGLNQFIWRFNKDLVKSGSEHSFYLTYPPHWDETNRFVVYCQTVLSLLQKTNKRLYLGDCNRLRSYLNRLDLAKPYKGTEEHPAIAALGYVVTALHEYEPWTKEISVPSAEDEDPLSYFAEQEERAYVNTIEGDDYDDYQFTW